MTVLVGTGRTMEGKGMNVLSMPVLNVLREWKKRHGRRRSVLPRYRLGHITGNGRLQKVTVSKHKSPGFSTDKFKNKFNLIR